MPSRTVMITKKMARDGAGGRQGVGTAGDAGRRGASHRTVHFVIFTTILIDFAGFSILIPVLPLFADRLGASGFQIALILTSYALAQLIFLPAWGWLSDRYGRRPVILASLLGSVFSYALLVAAESLAAIYASRILAGMFAASVGTAQAVITDVTPPQERSRGMGQIGAAVGAAFVIGPALAGPMISLHERLPFLMVAVVAGLNFVLAWRHLPETAPPSHDAPAWRDLLRSLVPAPLRLIATVHDRRTGLYLYLFFHIFMAFAALEAVFPIYLGREFGANELEIGLIFALLGVFLVPTQGLLVGRLARSFSESGLVVTGLSICAVGLTAIAFVPSFGWFFVVGPIAAVGFGIAQPTFTSLYSQSCGLRETGSLLGESQAMATTGRVVGPVLAGLAMDLFFPGASFAAAGVMLLIAIGIFVAFRKLLTSGAREGGPAG